MLKSFLWMRTRAEKSPHGYFFACLLTLASVCVSVLACGHFADPLPQFQLGAMDVLRTHHISSNFLPIGYSTLLGWSYVAGSYWGLAGMHACAMLLNMALLLLTFITLRAILRTECSSFFASSLALLLSLYPELLEDTKKISDTISTLLVLSLILLAMVNLRRRPDAIRAVAAGAAFAAAVLLRANLILMPLLLLWALWPVRWKRVLRLGLVTLASAASLYCLVTFAVHGKPFLPQNGAYNLYAGANPHTEASLLTIYNAESSIIKDMADHGMQVDLDWSRPENLPGIRDARDTVYQPYFTDQARSFIRHHPGQMLELSFLKLVTFLRPETKHYHFFDAHKSGAAIAWLSFKSLESASVPCWLCTLYWFCRGKLRLESVLILSMTLLYVLPFLIVNSDPRFRTPLDVLLAADIARMLYLRSCQRTNSAALVAHPEG